MTILYPIGSYYPAQLGGPSNTIYWLAKAMHEKGYSVYVGTTDHGINEKNIIRNMWVKTESGTVLYQQTLFMKLPLRLILRLIPVIKKANIIHLTSLFYPLSWILATGIIMTGQKCRILWSTRGELDDKALAFNPVRKKFFLYLIKMLFKKKVVFHTTSEKETNNLIQQFGKDVSCVQLPNYIYIEDKISDNPGKTILFLGRLHPIKGIENLIQAFSGINEKSGFKLVIAGDDRHEYADRLKKLCLQSGLQNDVKFIGHIEDKEKEKWLGAAHVVVLPSYSENFGNVVLEALAHGTPVIASTNTPWEILNSIIQGSWVANDAASLQKSLEMYMKLDTDEYMQVRKKAQLICRNHFSITENIGKWESAYQDLLSSRGKNEFSPVSKIS